MKSIKAKLLKTKSKMMVTRDGGWGDRTNVV